MKADQPLSEKSAGIAKDNAEFLYQFLSGTGKDVQEHTDLTKDRVLQDFVNSPGAQAIREQYAKMGYPAWTGKLSYGTKQAFNETIVQKFFDAMAPPGSALAVDGETSNSSTAQLLTVITGETSGCKWADLETRQKINPGHRQRLTGAMPTAGWILKEIT